MLGCSDHGYYNFFLLIVKTLNQSDGPGAILEVLNENHIMAEESAPVTTSTDDHKKDIRRQLNGTSFLTLEHVGYFVLVALLPCLLLMGASTAVQLWRTESASTSAGVMSFEGLIQPTMMSVNTAMAVSLTAALLVLVPLMYVLRRRTMAEYAKRPGYTGRVAYKLPVYTALALLAAQTVGSFVVMLGVFLNSLVHIGVKGADIGAMYVDQFLPALLAFVVFGMAAWYVMWFAKGRDASKMFVGSVSLLSAVMVIALFVTALTINHDSKRTIDPISPQPFQIEDDFLRY